MKTILILEDNPARALVIESAISAIGKDYSVLVWNNVHSMRAECAQFFHNAALISLDHDLTPLPGIAADPGTGMDMAIYLADFMPVCPVIVHSQNMERVWSMYNELRFAGWMVKQAGGLGFDWSEAAWLKCARELLAAFPNTWKANLPSDHVERLERSRLSLDGLGLGDALGEMLSYRSAEAFVRLAENHLPAGPWRHTDDTEMAISIYAVLKSHGELNQDALARRFARRFERDPERGYGSMTRIQLREINRGSKWRDMAASAFGGQGSLGNGAAMRVAPLGAYFADDLAACAEAARASAMVTHTHPEGVAGAVSGALASALAWRLREVPPAEFASEFFTGILQYIPEGPVRDGIVTASKTPADTSFFNAAKVLGNGSRVIAADTVPFCLWMSAHHPREFVAALGQTISVGGDCDTNAAIVGGIVALSAGRQSIPVEWLKAREAVEL